MEKVILYVDDAAYAREFLARMAAEGNGRSARHWVLVACAPRMTHRISKWVSHSARENWRSKWFAKVQEQLMPAIQSEEGDLVTPLLAKGPLAELTRRLRLEHGVVRVIDARRPKAGLDLEPVAADAAPPGRSGLALPSALLSMGALMMLASEFAD